MKLFLTFFVIYAIFTQFIGPNESSHLDLIRSIVDEGRFEIDSYHNNTMDKRFFNGHYYSKKAPGLSLLAIPIYMVVKPFLRFIPEDLVKEYPPHIYLRNGIYIVSYTIRPYDIYVAVFPTIFISGLLSALTVLLVYRISLYFTSNEHYRLVIAITYGIGTIAFYYATVFFSHAAATFFGFCCFYLIFEMRKKLKDYSFLAGVVGGLAVITEYPTLIIILGCWILILFTKDIKKIISFSIGFLLILSLLFVYNYIAFGNALALPYEYSTILRTDAFHGIKKTYLSEQSQIIIQKYNYPLINIMSLSIITKLLFYPYRGLFIYNPILIISIIGLFFMYRAYKKETILIALFFTMFLIYNSNIIIPWGGSCFGPRHLLPVLPFLMIPLAFSFERFNFRIISIFVILSIIINIIGMQIPEQSPLLQNNGLIRFYQDFGVDKSPLKDHYLPLFIENKGPRSAILESLFDDNAFIVMYLLIGISLYLIYRSFSFFKKEKGQVAQKEK